VCTFRDLKPENVLLQFGERGSILTKLCDFGVSCRFSGKVPLRELCGSPGFFAPEMVTHGSYLGDQADIWSCGCILLELVLGHKKVAIICVRGLSFCFENAA
jgi:serine/threonine protein kinase